MKIAIILSVKLYRLVFEYNNKCTGVRSSLGPFPIPMLYWFKDSLVFFQGVCRVSNGPTEEGTRFVYLYPKGSHDIILSLCVNWRKLHMTATYYVPPPHPQISYPLLITSGALRHPNFYFGGIDTPPHTPSLSHVGFKGIRSGACLSRLLLGNRKKMR